jgi:NADPH:quinone reductase-like Zn-dependent oxidoreductase
MRRHAARLDHDQPFSGQELGERTEPAVTSGRTTVTANTAPLNHHDPSTPEGVGIHEDQPMILGCDAADVDKAGNEVAE